MMQNLLFDIPSDWTPPTEFPNLHGDIAIDLETKDPWLKSRGAGWAFDLDPELRGHPVGVAVGAEGGQWYFPFAHEGGGNLDRDNVYAYVRDLLKMKGKKIFHNGIYDCGWLTREGFEVPWDEVHDTQFCAGLLDENRFSYSLDDVAYIYTGERKDEKLLREVARAHRIDPKSEMYKLHSRYVGAYAAQDGGVTYRTFRAQEPLMKEQQLERVYSLECSLIEILVKMRMKGVPVDLDRAEQVKAMFQKKEQECIDEVNRLTNLRVRPGIPSKDAVAVLHHLGLSVPKTLKGADSVTAGFLETVDHPIAKLIVKSRQYQKAYKDFIDSAIFKNQVNGRIHASFHNMMSDEGGTVTGRFSSSGPNLQNVPARNPETGPYIRSIYVGEEGEQLAPLDYSSQEPRWTLHFSRAINAPGAAQACRTFWDNPRTDYHGMMADICFPDSRVLGGVNKRRRAAKDIFLGLCYGMGGAKLCETLGLPTDTWETPDGKIVKVAGAMGKEILQEFKTNAPFVTVLQKRAEQLSKTRGYVKTILGRRCRTEYHHKSLNRIIQGSSADQGKTGIVCNWQEYKKLPLMLVHDELVYSVTGQEEANQLAHVMETCIPDLYVPFVVDAPVVPNWGAVKK
jgi:DNA polymerase I-like protein with 3'-5' exonuclease and polymerase domains